ncbi:MAG: sugar ABC transporter ATP-binding protein [Granulosicoccus sp.]
MQEPSSQDQNDEAQGAGINSPAIRFEHISKIFGGIHALDDVSFEVRRGEVHCLAGENGSGKSTLIKLITGVYQPETGAQMEYFGHTESSVTPKSARQHGIAVIWQDLALFPEMTVAENIAFDTVVGNVPRLVSHRGMRQVAKIAMAKLDMRIDPDVRLNSLPISQRQIVAIARALVSDAKLIFMDEPTASLSQSETDHLLDVVRSLSARGVAVVFVSHRLAEVLDIASRVTVLRDGLLVGVYDTEGMTQSRLAELMTGKTLDAVPVSTRNTTGLPVLEVENLTRSDEYDNISFKLHAGDVLGITGLIGSGRTELCQTLFGLTRPDGGTIRLEGKPLVLRSNRDAVEQGIAYVSEDRLTLGLVQPQSIADNLVLPVLKRISGHNGLISKMKQQELVHHWIAQLAVKIGQPVDPVSSLSGGNQQKVVLAKWLATEPKVLILDSPTVGVDVGARAGIFRIVRRLAESGLAIILISDEVPEVYINADRIIRMMDGRFIQEYDPQKIELRELEDAVYA